MGSLGGMTHRITLGKDGPVEDDGFGGTRPSAKLEIATVWASATQLAERRLLEFSELGIQEAYRFECYYDPAFDDAHYVRYKNKWLTINSLTEVKEDGWFLKIVAIGKD